VSTFNLPPKLLKDFGASTITQNDCQEMRQTAYFGERVQVRFLR